MDQTERDALVNNLRSLAADSAMPATLELAAEEIERLRNIWMEFVVNDHCGLCENTGRLHVHHTILAKSAHESDEHIQIGPLPCICPNGRVIRAEAEGAQ